MSIRLHRVLACLVMAGMLCSLGLVLFHNHAGSSFRPDCPACQFERTIGSSSGAVVVVGLVPPPIVVGLVSDAVDTSCCSVLIVRQVPPRSPPLPL